MENEGEPFKHFGFSNCLNYALCSLSEVDIQAGRNLEKCFFLGGQKGGLRQRFLPQLTLCRVALFSLQGPATSAGPTTARAGVRRRPCWCAPGWPASPARSRSSTPTELAPVRGRCQTPKGLADVFWKTTTNKTFLSAFSLEWVWGRTAGGPGEGREVNSSAKPPGRVGEGRAFSPEPARGRLHKNIGKENSALANGEILRAAIN